jgi:2,3-dihydroxybenzoate decarboxylase
MERGLVAFEEHFSIRELASVRAEYMKRIGFPVQEKPGVGGDLGRVLSDIEEFRLPAMDRFGIARQVLSASSPAIQGLVDAAEAVRLSSLFNDRLAEVVARHPDRFSGFAALPLQDPPAAARELERAVRELGLRGALVNGHTNGLYLDHPSLRIVWERAEGLGVPISLHVNDPMPGQWKNLEDFPELLTAAWGWGTETGTHALRILCSGLFDDFPKASLIVGHLGETIPYALWRLDNQWANARSGGSLLEGSGVRRIRELPSYYAKRNLYVTTSGNFSDPALRCAIDGLGIDRILFAVDYPFESTEVATAFFSNAPITDAERERLAWRNGAELLKIS